MGYNGLPGAHSAEGNLPHIDNKQSAGHPPQQHKKPPLKPSCCALHSKADACRNRSQ